MAITPVPSTRVSDLLVRQRLLNQLSVDQLDMVRLQTQLSTGRRIFLASEDAPAALRAIELQRLLERKEQVQINLQTNQSFLSATDSAMTAISGLLAQVRGTVLSVVDSVATDSQRSAAAEEISRAIQQLVDTGNQKFRGRYLFAGSRTNVAPFESDGHYVRYSGNEGTLSSFADIDLLFSSNVDGNSVFGAISEPVEGSIDVNPVVTSTTRLADLHLGAGIELGSIALSDGTQTTVVDLSKARTVGDVAAVLEANPPTGRKITVSITSSGLTVQLDAAGGGDLTIKEVGGGTTANQLGILQETSNGTGTVVGGDLNPRLTTTTALGDLLGVRAGARLLSAGGNNDLQIQALTNGAEWNGVTISLVDNPAITVGNESVVYDDSDPLNKTLVFQIDAGNTTANDLVAALQNDPVAGALFKATLISSDTLSAVDAGMGVVDVTATAVTADGSGTMLDQSAGLQIVSGERTYQISLATAKTVEDLLNQINGSGAAVIAEINAWGTGINVRSRESGADFSIGENGGSTATQLGLRSLTTETRLEDLNHGLGVHSIDGADFVVQRKDGTKLSIDVSGANTIGDVLDLINNHPDNQVAANRVTARLSLSGNGIELVTSDPSTAATFAVTRVGTSEAAEDLGLIPRGSTTSAAAVGSGATETITGRDPNPAEVDGMFNTLIRLRDALLTNDRPEIERAVGRLDQNSVRLNFARAEIGARQQGLDVLQSRLDSEVISLKDSLSKEIDVDLAQAISDLTARQAAFEAGLRTTAAISRLSLLDFL